MEAQNQKPNMSESVAAIAPTAGDAAASQTAEHGTAAKRKRAVPPGTSMAVHDTLPIEECSEGCLR